VAPEVDSRVAQVALLADPAASAAGLGARVVVRAGQAVPRLVRVDLGAPAGQAVPRLVRVDLGAPADRVVLRLVPADRVVREALLEGPVGR
jgi:hypothetical protein